MSGEVQPTVVLHIGDGALQSMTTFSLRVGEWYDYAIPGCPKGGGTFLGYANVTPQVDGLSFLVFQGVDEDGPQTGEVVFLNPALLSMLRPETLDGITS